MPLPHPVSAPSPEGSERPVVLDVSRLVWRLWRRRLPTGIDRVCLAYLEAFASRSLALLQWRGYRAVLGERDSDALFALLARSGASGLSRKRLVVLLARAIPAALAQRPSLGGRVYLNVGHTGLHDDTLPGWLRRAGLRPVHLVHDLIPITHPEFCRAGEAAKHTQRMRNALRGASGIVVNSADTGTHLDRFAADQGLAMPPLLVAPLGIERLFPATGRSPHPRPYFLSLGTIEGRKNHMLLLRAWDRLRQDLGAATPDLVLIGQRGWKARETFALLDAPPARHGIVIELGHCSDRDLAGWIDHARAMLMPSRVEGYGLPVLEALSRGTPVIASHLEVYREIAAGIPLLLDPDDVAGWCDAVREYLGDGPDRERQLRALAQYTPPDWAGHMALVEQWLMRLPRA
ncbi:glycosyltransferase family 4 protein [Novosphingobium sp. BL-52-GroH]|uniref:glycosyltransferase family 4 protein n=1 Tax=Novosphingobium sp. BL-52-GroH TaxID=3349877 RepID=UPI0038511916